MSVKVPEVDQLERNTAVLVKVMDPEKANIFINQVMIQEIYNVMTLKAQRRVARNVNKLLKDKILEWTVKA